jgi:hypothetical protein
MNKESFTPVMTLAMKEMLINCRDRELLRVSPRLNYDLATSKKLVDLGYFKAKAILQKDGSTGMAFFVTQEGADYLRRMQRRVPPGTGNDMDYLAA